jgi:hypothetical protein
VNITLYGALVIAVDAFVRSSQTLNLTRDVKNKLNNTDLGVLVFLRGLLFHVETMRVLGKLK